MSNRVEIGVSALEAVWPSLRRGATRGKILDAALALTDFVRTSGVHRATIYPHFKLDPDDFPPMVDYVGALAGERGPIAFR